MTQSEENEAFYVALPDGDNDHDIPSLIRWALGAIKRRDPDTAILMSEFLLRQPMRADSKPMIYADYSTEEGISSRQNIAIQIDFTEPTDENVGCLIAKMSEGDLQEDGMALLYGVADALEQHKDLEVLDLIYHDFIEDTGMGRPFVRVYLKRMDTRS